jgi:hypothetical protein
MTHSRDGEYIFDLDGQEDLEEDDGVDLTQKFSIDSRMYGMCLVCFLDMITTLGSRLCFVNRKLDSFCQVRI